MTPRRIQVYHLHGSARACDRVAMTFLTEVENAVSLTWLLTLRKKYLKGSAVSAFIFLFYGLFLTPSGNWPAWDMMNAATKPDWSYYL